MYSIKIAHMKKITLVLVLLLTFFETYSQIVNEPANWPNTEWTVEGTNLDDADVFESDPTLTTNFAYDDDDAGSGVDNEVSAASPIIDLTAAADAGENWITVTGNYVHRYLANDFLIFQYWDADSETWMDWGSSFTVTTAAAPTNNYCSVASVPYETDVLNITAFTATQLSGFKYRIYYNDDLTGPDYNYGFCFDSPTITSQTPPTCPEISGATITNVNSNSADITWAASNTETSWEIVVQEAGTGEPTEAGSTTTANNPYTATDLEATTPYEVYIRSNCESNGFSNWTGPYNFTTTIQTAFDVDCTVGPVNNNYCYLNNDSNLFEFTSLDGSPLNITFNSGQVEGAPFDFLVVLDSDGVTELYNDEGNDGNLTGLTFQSTGDTIYFQITSDGSVSCGSGSASYVAGIDYTVACATCVNPQATYDVVSDCVNGPQFFVEVDITDLGSAGSLTVSDNQDSATQTVSATGTVTFGPYPNNTDVVINIANDDDVNCSINSNALTQELCLDAVVDCSVGPLNVSYCYQNNDTNVFTYTSSDGNPLNLTINSGVIEGAPFDFLVVLDSDGVTELYNGEGNDGDLAGLTFQSTGDTIYFQITSDGSVSCGSGSTNYIDGIDYTVACATCVNPQATYDVVSDCINGPQFFVEVDITDLGSAGSVTVSDNQDTATQTVSATGTVTFGPYPNNTDVVINIANDDDVNCSINSNALTQELCLDAVVDCSAGPLNVSYCYQNSDTNVFTYTSSDGNPLNLTINSGVIEGAPFDFLVVLDSDGVTELYNGEGNDGDLAGLTFQSTGDTIYFQITSDGSVSCGSGSTNYIDGIDYMVSCATCINPAATYQVVDDCDNGEQFLIDVNVTTLGDATSLTISNNINGDTTAVTETGVYQVGPFPFLTDVIITINNDQDVNCVINSSAFQLLACPPENDNPCSATIAAVNEDESCDSTTPGTLLEATSSGVPNGSCAGNPDDDVWFEFEALGEQQIISINNIVGGFNIDHAVYEGTCDNLIEIYCSDDDTSVTPTLTIGNTYYIRVFSGGNQPSTATFDLCINTLGPPTFCLEALPICALDLEYPSITGDDVAPPYLDYGCLGSQPDPTWNAIYFDLPGDYTFTLAQTGLDGVGNDIDFIVWGPFNDQQGACYELLPETVADCSFSAVSVETITLNGVQAGDVFLILITNFSQDEGFFTFTQATGPDNGTNCEIVCDAEVLYQDVVVEEDATNPGFSAPIELCGIDSIDLVASSPYADTYQWYYQEGIPIDGATDPTLTVTESGNYFVEVSGDVCEGSSLSIQVIIGLGSEAVANAVDDIVTCDDASADGFEEFDLDMQTATILGAQAATDFNVSYHATLQDAQTNMNALTSPYTNVTNPQTIFVRVEDANANFCFVTSNFDLIISGPTPTATSVDIESCDDGTGNAAFDLAAHDGNILDGQNPEDYTVSYYETEADAEAGTNAIDTSTLYTSSTQTIFGRVESNISFDCYSTTSFDLIVKTLPSTSFTEDFDYEVCPNATSPIIITATPNNYTASEVSIEWYRDGGLITGENNLDLAVLEAGFYEIQVSFNDATQCSATVGIDVIELETCVIPEGISPNGDGMNDTFDLSSYNVSKIEIFNRNGTLVYKKRNYTNEWHGQSDEGDELPVGTYFYTMEYENGKQRAAWVYIQRLN